MHEREGSSLHVRHDPVGDLLVVARKLDLRDAEFGIDQPVRMRDPDGFKLVFSSERK